MNAQLPEISLPTTPLTSNSPKHTSLIWDQRPNSRTQSGDPSYWDLLSILMLCSVGITQQSRILKSPTRSEISLSRLERQRHPRRSKQPGTGLAPGTRQQLQQSSHSLIVKGNARITENKSSTCLPPSPKSIITSSSTMTAPFKSESH